MELSIIIHDLRRYWVEEVLKLDLNSICVDSCPCRDSAAFRAWIAENKDAIFDALLQQVKEVFPSVVQPEYKVVVELKCLSSNRQS